MDSLKFDCLVEYVRHNYVCYKPDLWKCPAKHWAHSYTILPAEAKGEFLHQLITESAKTKLAWDSISLIAQEGLRSDESLPGELANWVADVLDYQRPRPTTGGQGSSIRDRMFTLAVWDLKRRFRLLATSSSATDRKRSACDVVAAVANVDAKTVEAAWNKRDPILS